MKTKKNNKEENVSRFENSDFIHDTRSAQENIDKNTSKPLENTVQHRTNE